MQKWMDIHACIQYPIKKPYILNVRLQLSQIIYNCGLVYNKSLLDSIL